MTLICRLSVRPNDDGDAPRSRASRAISAATMRRASTFEQLDRRMRVYETAHDHCVLPGVHIVARIDGRSFSQLTRDVLKLTEPYDLRMRDCMVKTLEHLCTGTGFKVLFGYTQSDELNLLLRRDENLFGRKLRKLVSVLAGEASAKFSLELGRLGAFDARISQLPTDDDVVDYFHWRAEDAHRNALNGHAYWLLRTQGLDEHTATAKLAGASVADRNELLFKAGINFNDLPAWERRGVAVQWRVEPHEGTNPKTGETVTSTRRVPFVNYELPMKTEFDDLVRAIVVGQ